MWYWPLANLMNVFYLQDSTDRRVLSPFLPASARDIALVALHLGMALKILESAIVALVIKSSLEHWFTFSLAFSVAQVLGTRTMCWTWGVEMVGC